MAVINIHQIQRIELEMLRETDAILRKNGIRFYMCCGSVLGTVRHGGPIPWDTDMDLLIPADQLNRARDCLEKELSPRFCIDDLQKNKKYKNLFPRVALPHTSSDTLHIDLFPLMGLPDDADEQLRICRQLAKRQKTFIFYKHMRENLAHPNAWKNCIGKMIEVFCSPFSKQQLTRQYWKIIERYPYASARCVMNACGHYGAKNIFEKEVFGEPEQRPYCGLPVPLPQQWDYYLRRYYKSYMELPPAEERDKWLTFTLGIDDGDYERIKDIADE